MHTIYLDHAAATPLRPEVYEVMLPYVKDMYGNPSSIHQRGREASHVLTAMRNSVAETLAVHPHEIVFTGSGSEANNLALIGAVRAFRAGSQVTERAHCLHILISSIEHASVLEAGRILEEQGFAVEYLPVDRYGHVTPAAILERLRESTVLISVMYANNEIGTIEPLKEIALLLSQLPENRRPLFHTDACQAGGQLPIAPHELGVDLLTLNGSKLGGPRGVGMLYVKAGTRILPHIVGGNQESGRRAGTENLPAIVGFAHALALAEEERILTAERLTTFRDMCIREVCAQLPDTVLNGHPTMRLPGNMSFSFPYIEGESLVLLLDTFGVCASTGSACNAHDLVPSHVLRAIGQSHELIHGSLRLTLGRDTTESELNFMLKALTTSVHRLRELSSLTAIRV